MHASRKTIANPFESTVLGSIAVARIPILRASAQTPETPIEALEAGSRRFGCGDSPGEGHDSIRDSWTGPAGRSAVYG